MLSRFVAAAGGFAVDVFCLGNDRGKGCYGLRRLSELKEGTPEVGLRCGRGWPQALGQLLSTESVDGMLLVGLPGRLQDGSHGFVLLP